MDAEQLKQMIKGVGAANIKWPHPGRQEQPDVKTELAKLNSSKCEIFHLLAQCKLITQSLTLGYVYQNQWPDNKEELGAVTAVSFDKAGNVVMFHRVDRIWGPETFDRLNVYQEKYRGPIQGNTVLGLEAESGKVLYQWGKNL